MAGNGSPEELQSDAKRKSRDLVRLQKKGRMLSI
jgi:hypothetical protein